jgi:MoaA/NifB/PqqE/SkfB family radical SAM enzyme
MAQMSFVFNRNIRGINLMGGEPLLNPNINEYVKITRRYFPKAPIDILTNAVLLDDMDKSFWETLNENNVSIVPSIYPVKIDWASVIDKAQKYNVGIYGNYKCEEKLTVDNIDKFQKNFFYKMTLNKNGDDIDKSNCGKRYGCNSMYDGKLFPCFPIAYVRHLNKKFNTDFIVSGNDYLDLYKVKNLSEVEEFLKIPKQYPFCKYGTLNSGEVKWENSPEHSLSEWT